MFRTILVLALMFSLPAFAKGKGGGGPGGKGGGGANVNPACAPIRSACEKAGYKGRVATPGTLGSIRDCLHKWNGGSPITGLTLKPTDAAAKECSAHLTKMKQRRGRGGAGAAGAGGPGMRGGGGGRGGIMGLGTSRPKAPSPLIGGKTPSPMIPAVRTPAPMIPAARTPGPTAPTTPATPPPKKP